MTKYKIKPLYLFSLLLLVGFGVYGATGIKNAFTPYVDITQAKATTDRVQVKGELLKSSLHTDNLGRLIFDLKDFKTKETFTVVYSAEHPANMQMARDVVAMGSWNPHLGFFESDQMNIKCPDKYAPGAGTPAPS